MEETKREKGLGGSRGRRLQLLHQHSNGVGSLYILSLWMFWGASTTNHCELSIAGVAKTSKHSNYSNKKDSVSITFTLSFLFYCKASTSGAFCLYTTTSKLRSSGELLRWNGFGCLWKIQKSGSHCVWKNEENDFWQPVDPDWSYGE